MALTFTQSWDRVTALLTPRPNRKHQPHEPLLRVIQGLRDPSNPYALFPELEGETLNLYDQDSYDHTFRARSLSVTATRKPAGYLIKYAYHAWGHHPPDEREWLVPRDAGILGFLLDRLAELAWQRR